MLRARNSLFQVSAYIIAHPWAVWLVVLALFAIVAITALFLGDAAPILLAGHAPGGSGG
jgi:hypothetical protein